MLRTNVRRTNVQARMSATNANGECLTDDSLRRQCQHECLSDDSPLDG